MKRNLKEDYPKDPLTMGGGNPAKTQFGFQAPRPSQPTEPSNAGYENVVFLQGDEAAEALQIFNNEGEDALLQYLTQWHYPGEHEVVQEVGSGSTDEVIEKDGYIINVNSRYDYVGLSYDLSHQETPELAGVEEEAPTANKAWNDRFFESSNDLRLPIIESLLRDE